MYIFNPSFKRVIAGDRPIPDLPFLTILFIPFLILWNRAEFLPKPHHHNTNPKFIHQSLINATKAPKRPLRPSTPGSA